MKKESLIILVLFIIAALAITWSVVIAPELAQAKTNSFSYSLNMANTVSQSFGMGGYSKLVVQGPRDITIVVGSYENKAHVSRTGNITEITSDATDTVWVSILGCPNDTCSITFTGYMR